MDYFVLGFANGVNCGAVVRAVSCYESSFCSSSITHLVHSAGTFKEWTDCVCNMNAAHVLLFAVVNVYLLLASASHGYG